MPTSDDIALIGWNVSPMVRSTLVATAANPSSLALNGMPNTVGRGIPLTPA